MTPFSAAFFALQIRSVIAVFPLATLLLVQINTLRYQSELITWTHRSWIVIDLVALVWFFRRNPLDGSDWPTSRIASIGRWEALVCPTSLV
jgi:hypothetical protein